MTQDASALIWIDLEMTGLDPDRDRIIEIATIVTDAHLNIVAEGPVLAVHQSAETLAAMDEWNTRTHGETGLTARVKASDITEAQAEAETLAFVQRHVPRNKSPLCGNSICQDRRFLYRYMPQLEQWLHYRNLDVSTIKELARRWVPSLEAEFKKQNTHRALEDIRESIAELLYYREHFLRLNETE
jgi:oligoribonuclease